LVHLPYLEMTELADRCWQGAPRNL